MGYYRRYGGRYRSRRFGRYRSAWASQYARSVRSRRVKQFYLRSQARAAEMAPHARSGLDPEYPDPQYAPAGFHTAKRTALVDYDYSGGPRKKI